RLLGIEIPATRIRDILVALGLREVDSPSKDNSTSHSVVVPEMKFLAPSWRNDLTREVDLIEEVARIHGYEKIPENVAVSLLPSARSDHDRVIARLRHVLTATGFHEAMTASVVPANWSDALSPWTSSPSLRTQIPLLRGADCLRRSILPSLLGVRRENERQATEFVELFEIAKVYLPVAGAMPQEPLLLGITSGRTFLELKGVLETLVGELSPAATIEIKALELPNLRPGRTVELQVGPDRLGFLGEVGADGLKQFELHGSATVAELNVEVLQAIANLVPRYVPLPAHPAVDRDLNLILTEQVSWNDLERVVKPVGQSILEQLAYRETYRDPDRDGAGYKRVLVSLRFRAPDRTLTSDEVDAVCRDIVRACENQVGARLLA
ncbi:MAG TPA: phenylalanine--tRNA ligase subunit beta, partial [Pirellulaceae bacterium]